MVARSTNWYLEVLTCTQEYQIVASTNLYFEVPNGTQEYQLILCNTDLCSVILNWSTIVPQQYHNSTTIVPQQYHNSATIVPEVSTNVHFSRWRQSLIRLYNRIDTICFVCTQALYQLAYVMYILSQYRGGRPPAFDNLADVDFDYRFLFSVNVAS